MKNKQLFYIAIFIFLLIPNLSFAHTSLDHSTPQKDEMVTTDLKEFSLSFNSKIEKGSSFEIINEKNKTIPVSNIQIKDHTMKGTIPTPLANGKYKVRWDIIGADGHPIQGEYSFQIQKSEKNKSEKPQVQKKNQDPNHAQTTIVNSEQTKKSAAKNHSSTVVILIACVAIIALGSFIWLLKRKSKS